MPHHFEDLLSPEQTYMLTALFSNYVFLNFRNKDTVYMISDVDTVYSPLNDSSRPVHLYGTDTQLEVFNAQLYLVGIKPLAGLMSARSGGVLIPLNRLGPQQYAKIRESTMVPYYGGPDPNYFVDYFAGVREELASDVDKFRHEPVIPYVDQLEGLDIKL